MSRKEIDVVLIAVSLGGFANDAKRLVCLRWVAGSRYIESVSARFILSKRPYLKIASSFLPIKSLF